MMGFATLNPSYGPRLLSSVIRLALFYAALFAALGVQLPFLPVWLAAKGLVFNQPDVAPFREKLRSAGFYAEWKGKYGEQAWGLLEKSVGRLS